MVHSSDWMGCVLVMHACQLHVCLLQFHSMCLLHLHDVDHGCSDLIIWKLMLSLWSASLGVYDGLHVVICRLHVLFFNAWLHSCMFGNILV